MDRAPLWMLFAVMTIFVVIAIEAGYRLGRFSRRRQEEEKESPVSAMVASTLGLLAFMLAIAFGMVTDRFDARKALVRDEANAIRTAYSRSDFLPEPDRGIAVVLIRDYLDHRLAAVQSLDSDKIRQVIIESGQIQRQLWDMAVVNARKDMNSDVAALYIESLNEVSAVHAQRVAVGWQMRLPAGIWLTLYILTILGMFGVGYQTAIAVSRRSWVTLIMAVSFALVITLIAVLDRPQSGFMRVPQQPLLDLRASIVADLEARSGIGNSF